MEFLVFVVKPSLLNRLLALGLIYEIKLFKKA